MKCKSSLRREVLGRRSALPAHEIQRLSSLAGSRLLELPELIRARTVMFFVSFGSEIETLPILERALAAGKRVVAPRSDVARRGLVPCEVRDPARDLSPGAHGILEPRPTCPVVAPEEIDVVIVPAAVWAQDGHRIGYGAGYYDRFLARATNAVRVGLGFELQVVPDVPRAAHDLPVDVLVTDAAVRRFAKRPDAATGSAAPVDE